MKKLNLMKSLVAMSATSVLLVACGGGGGGGGGGTTTTNPTTPGSGSPTIGTASLSGTTYTAEVDGKTYSAASTATVNGDPGFLGRDVNINGVAYRPTGAKGAASDYVAFGGASSSGTFVGQSGTQAAPSMATGSKTYSGSALIVSPGSESIGRLSLLADFDKATVTTSTGSLKVDGKIDGAKVTGTATAAGNKGDLAAGFYGTNELNGVATDGKNFVAIITTTQE